MAGGLSCHSTAWRSWAGLQQPLGSGGFPSHAMTSPSLRVLWSLGTIKGRVIPSCPREEQRGWAVGPTLFCHTGLPCFTNTFFGSFPHITHHLPMKRKESASERTYFEVFFDFISYMADTGVKAGTRSLIPTH